MESKRRGKGVEREGVDRERSKGYLSVFSMMKYFDGARKRMNKLVNSLSFLASHLSPITYHLSPITSRHVMY